MWIIIINDHHYSDHYWQKFIVYSLKCSNSVVALLLTNQKLIGSLDRSTCKLLWECKHGYSASSKMASSHIATLPIAHHKEDCKREIFHEEPDKLLSSLPLDVLSKFTLPIALPTSTLSCPGPFSTSSTLSLASVNAEHLQHLKTTTETTHMCYKKRIYK